MFVNRAYDTSARCEATATRIVQAMLSYCDTCRVVERRCLDNLDPRQRKILNGNPVDVPVMRTLGGVIAFASGTPALALEVCRETERRAPRDLPGSGCGWVGDDEFRLSVAALSNGTGASRMPQVDVLLATTLLATAISLLVCCVVIRFQRVHARYSFDPVASGPQKFHATPTARVGGVALAAALVGGVVATNAPSGLALLVLAAVPAFAGGFAEDITKRVSVIARLVLTISAGAIAAVLVGATLDRVAVPGFDELLQYPVFAVAFTALAVAGVTNAFNVIDGYNGLAGGYAVLVLGALAWVAVQVGDPVVLTASLIMLGALLGFLVLNYPWGRIFLGDGGAYLLGFWLAELSVLLVVRNPDVSPWFPLLLLAYPTVEMLFSIYRRTYLRGESFGQPDALHFHHLIFTRLACGPTGPANAKEITRCNNVVARYIWAGVAVLILPAVLFWRSTTALVVFALLFSVVYVWLYLRLLRMRGPAWLVNAPKTSWWRVAD
jgi:UDP-N-acetylmuramyl pentapeptide phosphotransferase/UDP-N-acetylglucosamine-1-phosphate transferase